MPAKRSTKEPVGATDTAPSSFPKPVLVDSSPSLVPFPVVGIGASAGGLAAFDAFFSGLATLTLPGMAFVLVQHLAPDHKSLLTELIRRCTSMPVLEVEDGMVVQPNCVYIIPPNHDMAFLNGTLHLLEPSAPRGQRLPIDYFFRSLAHDQCERAIGVVLSGTGSDGTLGARAIKGEGGMVIAQLPESSDFDGMPRSVIATGLADYVLPPAAMATQLIAYVRHAFGKLQRDEIAETPKAENALKKIFVLLRSQVGHDFSHYKPSTINRRIERRMAVHQIDDLGAYVKYLQQTPSEAVALFHDLLIGVTNFFRDPEVFDALEKSIIPKLFADRSPGSVLRVWSNGCSTGEEAYSIAILLQERMQSLKMNFTVQVFATDIDSRAITIARAGVYPASIAADVKPERLARFFSIEPDGGSYRIHKSIRDMLVFSEQNVIKDPPFSRLDLISCRNLMIYLGTPLQKKLIPLFHYALRPGGILLLGTSEGIGDFVDIFAVLDRKTKVFQRREDFPVNSSTGRPLSLPGSLDLTIFPESKKMSSPIKLSLRELTEQALLQHLAAAGALVNWHGDILYLHGRTGRYLEPAPGEVGTSNILKMAREGLRRDLTLTLQKVISTKQVARCAGLKVRTNGHFSLVNLTVCPVSAVGPAASASQPLSGAAESSLYLVILEEVDQMDAPVLLPDVADKLDDPGQDSNVESRIAQLRQELRAKDEYLQSTHEQLESSNEELKSSNEEMQSVNEELQSTNEELETSKEELQSVNEELATVNNELQAKVLDLSRANSDMNNLLAGNGVGTIFVDFQLRILRFTPAASSIINLIMSDVGRPVAHIVSNLVGYDSLVADTQAVLNTSQFKEFTVQTIAGSWYTMRIQPYRTLANVIEGAVISFIDITETVRTRDALHKANELLRLAVVVRAANDAITLQDLQGRTLAWNPAATRMYGWSEAEALAMNVSQRIPAQARDEAGEVVRQLNASVVLEPYRAERINREGQVMMVSITSTALLNEAGVMVAIATTEQFTGQPSQ